MNLSGSSSFGLSWLKGSIKQLLLVFRVVVVVLLLISVDIHCQCCGVRPVVRPCCRVWLHFRRWSDKCCCVNQKQNNRKISTTTQCFGSTRSLALC